MNEVKERREGKENGKCAPPKTRKGIRWSVRGERSDKEGSKDGGRYLLQVVAQGHRKGRPPFSYSLPRAAGYFQPFPKILTTNSNLCRGWLGLGTFGDFQNQK